jgi:hypothetical protein
MPVLPVDLFDATNRSLPTSESRSFKSHSLMLALEATEVRKYSGRFYAPRVPTLSEKETAIECPRVSTSRRLLRLYYTVVDSFWMLGTTSRPAPILQWGSFCVVVVKEVGANGQCGLHTVRGIPLSRPTALSSSSSIGWRQDRCAGNDVWASRSPRLADLTLRLQ